MAYRFRLRGNGFRHSWEKECQPQAAMIHAAQVARECARDRTYQGAAIRVLDDAGNEVAVVAVSKDAK